MKKIILFAVLFLSIIFTISAQDFSELEKVVTAEMQEKNAVGAGIAIISGDKVIYSKGFGVANIETSAPITADTLFQNGSITKTFTAALILKLAEEGKLKLDAPVGDYVKELSPKLAKLTLAQLLSHTSGLIDEADEFGANDESLMASYIRSWKDDYALFDPGEVFSYSNSGYALAGFTAQEEEKKLYVDLMNEKVFQPTGMKSTTFRPTVAMTYPLAVGHTVKPNEKPQVVRPLPQDARLNPAGTMYTSLNDMSRFAIAFLNDGKLDGQQVLSPTIIKQISTPHGKQLSAADDSAYGYGMFMNTHRGVRELYHDGSMTGYVALVKLVPEQKLGIIILGNTNNIALLKTQEKVLEIMLKLPPNEDYKKKPALPISETEMKAYAGIYGQPNRWKTEIYVKDSKLFIKQFNQEMPLIKIGENRFSFQFPNARQPVEIYIQPSSSGKSAYIHQYVWAFKKQQ